MYNACNYLIDYCFCQVTFTFTNNTLTNDNGQGQDFYAEDIKYCVLDHIVNDAYEIFNSSIFSNTLIFNFRQVHLILFYQFTNYSVFMQPK